MRLKLCKHFTTQGFYFRLTQMLSSNFIPAALEVFKTFCFFNISVYERECILHFNLLSVAVSQTHSGE